MRDIYVPKKQKKTSRLPFAKSVKYLLLIIAIAIIVYFGFKIANAQIDKWLELEPIDVKKIEKDVNNTPQIKNPPATTNTTSSNSDNQPSEEITLPAIKTQPTKTTVQTPVQPTQTINKSDIKIRVLNGNGKPGSARIARQVLENNGYSVSSIGNARNQGYYRTVVYFNENKEKEAEIVQKTLSENEYNVITQKNIYLTGSSDLLIVIGNS